MNILTYARVSTPKQADAGESLANQRRVFDAFIERTGHTRLAHYEDSASGKNVVGRTEFRRMIADLPRLKPDLIVIDTMDRFTRNLRDGLNLLEELRGHRVSLLPLDWRRNRPIDLDDDRDWSDVVEEFAAAERERRRIRRRMLRSFEGRRERGATTTNRPPFGLIKKGDVLIPDPDTAWIVQEADKRALQGHHFLDIARWATSLSPDAWSASRGVTYGLANPAYVATGVRSVETQRALDELLELRRGRFGQRRKHANEFTGVFLCGHCFDSGKRALMVGTHTNNHGLGLRPKLMCATSNPQRLKNARHNFSIKQAKFEDQWLPLIESLAADPEFLKQWIASRSDGTSNRERHLTQRLAQIDQEAAALKARRDRALDLFTDKSPVVMKQVRKALQDVEFDETQLSIARQTVLGELAGIPSSSARDATELQSRLEAYREIYLLASASERNELNRALCAAVGSHPRLYRFSNTEPAVIEWPEVGALRRPPIRGNSR